MKKILNREQFTSYCRRRLGEPVIKLNIDSTQVDDRVDDAIFKFVEFHMDGSSRQYVSIQLTQEMIKSNQIFVPSDLGKAILSISKVYTSSGSTLGGTNFFSNAILTDVIRSNISTSASMASDSLVSWYYLKQSIAELDHAFSRMIETSYSYYWDRDRIDVLSLSSCAPGSFVVLEVFLANDPETNSNAWDSPWLKAYATALIKKQWGSNLSKFGGMSLPKGLGINFELILSSAEAEIEKLEEELFTLYSSPAMGRFG